MPIMAMSAIHTTYVFSKTLTHGKLSAPMRRASDSRLSAELSVPVLKEGVICRHLDFSMSGNKFYFV
jgi:hypothetical protein